MKVVVAMLAALPMLLTSCDSDPWYDDVWYDNWTWGNDYNNRPNDNDVDNDDFFVAMAQTLSGKWRGSLTAYQLDDAGNATDSLLYDTDIEFRQYNDRSISGTGTQYDYDRSSGELSMQRNFTWYIDPESGSVYLTYKEKDSGGTVRDYVMSVAYDDLNLDSRTFTGYLWAGDGYEVDDFWFDRYTGTRALAKAGAKRFKIVMR